MFTNPNYINVINLSGSVVIIVLPLKLSRISIFVVCVSIYSFYIQGWCKIRSQHLYVCLFTVIYIQI